LKALKKSAGKASWERRKNMASKKQVDLTFIYISSWHGNKLLTHDEAVMTTANPTSIPEVSKRAGKQNRVPHTKQQYHAASSLRGAVKVRRDSVARIIETPSTKKLLHNSKTYLVALIG
jgi:hypothetical protein